MSVRNLIIIMIILLIMSIAGLFFISLEKDTQVLVVNVTLARPPDDDSFKIISEVSASLSYARKMEVPRDTSLLSPGITVIVIQNMQEKSGWYSVPIPVSDSIYGNYTVKVRLNDKLNLDDPVTILTRVMDPAGKEVSVKRAVVMVS